MRIWKRSRGGARGSPAPSGLPGSGRLRRSAGPTGRAPDGRRPQCRHRRRRAHGAAGALGHDRSLEEEPALLTAAGSASRLILENARLQAEVRAQLLEVQQSRARIVAATNEARARLERDLHDGAQQRLLAIGIALQLLRQQPGNPALLAAAEEELTGALAEMRELASGIHPSVLTDLGLVEALQALASPSRNPGPRRPPGAGPPLLPGGRGRRLLLRQ